MVRFRIFHAQLVPMVAESLVSALLWSKLSPIPSRIGADCGFIVGSSRVLALAVNSVEARTDVLSRRAMVNYFL